MWENKSSTVADPHQFWTWWSFIYTLTSVTFPLKVRIIWSHTFPDGSSSYVVWVCNQCRWTNQNRLSMMGLTSYRSCISDTFSSYRISFSSMTSLTMTSLGLVHLVHAFFHFPLEIPLVVSVAEDLPFLIWLESSQLVKWWNALLHFAMVKWWNAIFYFAVVKWWNAIFRFVMVKWYPKLVESQKYLPAQNPEFLS